MQPSPSISRTFSSPQPETVLTKRLRTSRSPGPWQPPLCSLSLRTGLPGTSHKWHQVASVLGRSPVHPEAHPSLSRDQFCSGDDKGRASAFPLSPTPPRWLPRPPICRPDIARTSGGALGRVAPNSALSRLAPQLVCGLFVFLTEM